jgi:YfiH family protein
MRLIRANWDAPAQVHALTTTRHGGQSVAPYDGLNLGDHVEDRPESVSANRQLLMQATGLSKTPQWLQQVHGVDVVEAKDDALVRTADACFSAVPGQGCIVMTADCLPVLFTNSQGTQVAAAHAGWRGLAGGILEETLKVFDPKDEILAWLGPAIGPLAFEVGGEVKQAFVDQHAQAEEAFRTSPTHPQDRFLADIYQLARIRLAAAGVTQVSGGDHCTFSDTENFFSYRRDGVTGRMASLIWIEG